LRPPELRRAPWPDSLADAVLSPRVRLAVLTAARRRAGLDHATCHELRLTCLTRLREAGMALEAVHVQAGHAVADLLAADRR